MLCRRSRSLLHQMPLPPMCEIELDFFVVVVPFLLAFQCDVSRESAGRCFFLFFVIHPFVSLYSSLRLLWLYLQAMYCAAYRRAHTCQGYDACVYWTIPMWFFGKVADNQRWCERNRVRLNLSCRLPRNHCATLHILLRCAHTQSLTHSPHTRTMNVEKIEATSEWIFFESHSLTAIICS